MSDSHERFNNPVSLEWIMTEHYRFNRSVRGDVRQFLTNKDIPKLVIKYNDALDEGLLRYDSLGAKMYARQETKKYMAELSREKVSDVQLY